MQTRNVILISSVALGCIALAGCGGSDSGSGMTSIPTMPPAPTTQLDTASVLAIVQTKTSETSSPFMVDGGAVMVTPADDETSTPISVDGS